MLREGRVRRFVTPLVKVFRKGGVESFFDEAVFDEWRAANTKGVLDTRYYKGLGSHTPEVSRASPRDCRPPADGLCPTEKTTDVF